MAVKWKKIYRGGVQRTTPETREAAAPATGSLKPGMVVSLNGAGAIVVGVIAAGVFPYVVGEALHGDVEAELTTANANGTRDTVRLFTTHSGDLYAGRAAAGVALRDDLPLTVTAAGLLAAAVLGTDNVVAYVDDPASAFPKTTPTTTTAGQIIPIKIK